MGFLPGLLSSVGALAALAASALVVRRAIYVTRCLRVSSNSREPASDESLKPRVAANQGGAHTMVSCGSFDSLVGPLPCDMVEPHYVAFLVTYAS